VNASYDGSSAVTLYGAEARQENAFRSFISPIGQGLLNNIGRQFATQNAQRLASSTSLAEILTNAPQLITAPLAFTIGNVAPFNIPVASAITFVGLIYLLILSFFIVVCASIECSVESPFTHYIIDGTTFCSRDLWSGQTLANKVAYCIAIRHCICVLLLHLSTLFFPFQTIFPLMLSLSQLFYSLLSLAFQVDFSKKYASNCFLHLDNTNILIIDSDMVDSLFSGCSTT